MNGPVIMGLLVLGLAAIRGVIHAIERLDTKQERAAFMQKLRGLIKAT